MKRNGRFVLTVICAFFRRVRSPAKWLLKSLSPSVRLYTWHNSRTAERIFMKFDTGMFYENLSSHFSIPGVEISSTNAPNIAGFRLFLLFDDWVRSSTDLTVTAGFDFGHGWPWPPQSADLNPCDYFFQGLLKGKVYKNNHHPHMVEELTAEFTVAVEMSLKKQRQQ